MKHVLFGRKSADLAGFEVDFFEHLLLLFGQNCRQNLCRPAFRHGRQEELRRSGKLQAFNQAYAAHRKAAFVQGKGARLRLALVPVLTGRPVPLEGTLR